MDSSLSASDPFIPTTIITGGCQFIINGYILILFGYWIRSLSPSLKWKTPEKIPKKPGYQTIFEETIKHLILASVFFVVVKSLIPITQLVASGSSSVAFSFITQRSLRFLLPSFEFSDFLSIDISIAICKGIFSFIYAIRSSSPDLIETLFSLLFIALIFVSTLITSLSVLNPSRLQDLFDPVSSPDTFIKFNISFIWLILPSLAIFCIVPIYAEFKNKAQMSFYAFYVAGVSIVPTLNVLNALSQIGGVESLANKSIQQLLRIILYALFYAYGYKGLYILNSYINSFFDSELAPFNPDADDFSGSVIPKDYPVALI